MTHGHFWTKHHTGEGVTEKKEQRHDFRANGQFQYEHGIGGGGFLLDPQRLVQRRDGAIVKLGHSIGVNCGCSGNLMPCSTEGGAPQQPLNRRVDGRPWTGLAKEKYYSTTPFVPNGPPAVRVAVPTLHGAFHAGKGNYLSQPVPHLPFPYQAPTPNSMFRKPFALKAGNVMDTPKHKKETEPQQQEPLHKSRSKKTKRLVDRSVFIASKHHKGTFGRHPTFQPSPYEFAKMRSEVPPLFTWHSHSKRSMPVECPWSTGLNTSEALPKCPQGESSNHKRGSFQLTTVLDLPRCVEGKFMNLKRDPRRCQSAGY